MQEKRLIATAFYRLRQSPTLIQSHHITRFNACKDPISSKGKKHLVHEFVSVCCFFAFLCFLEAAHVLPVCMINLFPLIIYVIQNVIYVSVNFEL